MTSTQVLEFSSPKLKLNDIYIFLYSATKEEMINKITQQIQEESD